MTPYSGMMAPDGTLSFTHHDGRVISLTKTSLNYEKVKTLLRELDTAPDRDNDPRRDDLYELTQPMITILRSSGGRVRFENGVLYYDDEPVESFLTDRIVWMLREGFNVAPMLAFFENVKENPSFRAVEELYRFMEANRMGLTSDGMILAYKRVRDNYRDIRTNTFDNSVGQVASMPRNEVNDDPTQTCSAGLHLCSMGYLPHYGAGPGNRIVVCRLHPRDVVSVPIDYDNAKLRVCSYTVIDEIADTRDILGERSVWPEYSETEDDEDAEEAVEWNPELTPEREERVQEIADRFGAVAVAYRAEQDDKQQSGEGPSAFHKIAAGLQDAIAYAQGDSDRGRETSFEIRDTVWCYLDAKTSVMNQTACCLGVDLTDVTIDSTIADLQGDDLDTHKILEEIERDLGIRLTYSDFTAESTVGEIITTVHEKLNEAE